MHIRATLPIVVLVLSSACERPTPPTPRTRQVCVVRHAEAYKNVDERPEGVDLDALTPRGEEQARALTSRLPQGARLLLVSPAGRARATARLALDDADARVDDALRPMDGDVTWDARVLAWSKGMDPRPRDGESLADLAARAVRTLETAKRASMPPTHIVLVTHGDVASVLIGELRGTPLLARPTKDVLATGDALCVVVDD